MIIYVGKKRLSGRKLKKKAANIMSAQIIVKNQKRTRVLGLATGSTPVGLYKTAYPVILTKVTLISHRSSVNLDDIKTFR